MPPKGQPQPTAAERQQMAEWIGHGLEVARLRPAPKNGLVRRLTVAQYRNTLRELLLIDNDLTAVLPPDAVSKDGFLNNRDTLQLSPLLMEAYFEIAEKALDRAIVDPARSPGFRTFVSISARASIPRRCRRSSFSGREVALLENSDVLVTQLTPTKPFAFEPFFMRTKYRFIEGYRGNDTVRGWRDYDSIYHAVFADMRGSWGIRKEAPGAPFRRDCCCGRRFQPRRCSMTTARTGQRQTSRFRCGNCPMKGRFRVTVTAAKYNDGLLLDPGAAPRRLPKALFGDP